MNTTGIVLSLTDEQLKDIDEYCEMTQHIESGEQACVSLYELRGLLEELRRLRAENAGLGSLLREAGKTIHKLQAEQPTPLRIARYLDAMRAKIDTAMVTQ